jgi:hypothetical protein
MIIFLIIQLFLNLKKLILISNIFKFIFNYYLTFNKIIKDTQHIVLKICICVNLFHNNPISH